MLKPSRPIMLVFGLLLVLAFSLQNVSAEMENTVGTSLGSGATTGTFISFAVDEATPFSAQLICKYSPGLNEAQRNVCVEFPSVMSTLNDIPPVFYEQCVDQFRNDRWNCTSTVPPIFGESSSDLRRLSKETAFVHALTSAFMVHIVTKACSDGILTDCGCDTRLQGQQIKQGWQWGACSDDVDFGNTFARRFLDARETEGIENKTEKQLGQALVKLHNNGVGRKVVQMNMQTKCKCHGISGSCAIRTCWRKLPDLQTVSTEVKTKYDHAVKVSLQVSREAPASLRQVGKDRTAPSNDLLVFMKSSKNYCLANRNYTLGRECIPQNLKTDNEDNGHSLAACEDLCCNGEYNTNVSLQPTSCNCRFVWCCTIECDTCLTSVTTYTCSS